MILLIGHKGYVGHYIEQSIKEFGLKLVVLDCKIHYQNKDFLKDFLIKNQISFVINSAGFVGKSSIEECETNKTLCLLENTILPGIIKEVCEGLNIPFGHVSSGCIYSGDNNKKGFKETDVPNFSFRNNNSSFYSGSKAFSEEILKDSKNCYIWRLRIPFNHENNSKNYLYKVLNYKKLLNVCNSLSNINDFATGCVKSIYDKIPYGIYNMTNTGSITTKEIVEIMKNTIAKDKLFEFFKDEKEFMNFTNTPRSSCVLDNQKAINAGIYFSDIQNSIYNSLKKWN